MDHHSMSNYMAHGFCFLWEPALVWLHVISDIATGLAYYSIPAAIFYFVYKRRDLPFPGMFVLFGVFIFSCGTTHLLGAYTVYVPLYWQEGIVKAITAVVSIGSAILFIPLLPKAIALPSLTKALEEIKTLNKTLENQVEELRRSSVRLVDAQRQGKMGDWDTDLATNVMSWSDEVYAIFGMNPDRSITIKVGDFIKRIHPDDRQRVQDFLKETVDNAYDSWEIEYRIILDSGDEKHIFVTASVEMNDQGKPVRRRGTVQDITERKRADDKVRTSLKEKEILLKEIHHRVKNNLQIISSMLNLQSAHVKDKYALDLFRESRNRVKSMALIHEKLYQSKDLARIDFADYVRTLAEDLFRSYRGSSAEIVLKIDIEDVFLDIDKAVSCGLIINELITNSLKHAFPSGRAGEIKISLHPDINGMFVLTVRDNGRGLPEDVDSRNVESLGLQLVGLLVEQLDGAIELNRSGGTSFKISFRV